MGSRHIWSIVVAGALALAACGSNTTVVSGDDTVTVTSLVTVPATTAPESAHRNGSGPSGSSVPRTSRPSPSAPSTTLPSTSLPSTSAPDSAAALAPKTFTLALAGDINFTERTAAFLADPTTTFGVAVNELNAADVTIVNLETSITEGGTPAPKSFHFRAPPSALTALALAGVDVASMANNHAADYGASGVQDTLTAMTTSPVSVIGFGSTAAVAFAPYSKTIGGQRLSVFAATAIRDYTLANWSASEDSPGVANAFDKRLLTAVRQAKARGDVVVVYLHWGTEYESCPNRTQRRLADQLAAAGAAAVVGTHAHVLQGAGWRADGTYVAYGLGNYFWWRSFGNKQDENGVLTLTFTNGAVTAAQFSPSQLDATGIPVPAAGATRDKIMANWDRARRCAELADKPPSR